MVLRMVSVRNRCLTLLAIVAWMPSLVAQVPMVTNRSDSARTSANTNETLLTPENVNKNSFGHLFSVPIDPGATPVSTILAQPLYVPNVDIPGLGTHNVIYIATLADSVYALDADNGAQLWYASMLNGGTTASGSNLPCGFGGYKQEGIVSTPVIDLNTNTMYLVAKTVLNGAVRHDIHALDITTGLDRDGSPVQISAQSTSNTNNIWNKQVVTNFNSLHQKNRPGLLLVNGILYLGFGSNGCNDSNSGWVLSYQADNLSQLAVFNTSPAYGLTSVWQSGVGLATDDAGNVYAETAEAANANSVPNGYFDVPNGGETYCMSVLKLAPDLAVADYFTPSSVYNLNLHDFDMSSTGAMVLPDQDGPYPHELLAGGKQGHVYLLDRDNMGMWSAAANQIIQEITLEPVSTNAVLFGSGAYWNNTAYFAPNGSPVRAFPLSGGLLGTQVKTKQNYIGSHSPSISSNGNANGILWVMSAGLNAFNACIAPNCQNEFTPLQLLYTSNQAAGGRDKLPVLGRFVTQTVANGKVYIATQTTLEAYGLFESVTVTGGNNQTGTVNTPLSVPLQIHAANPYTGQVDVGTRVTFSVNCKTVATCGSFNPAFADTDASGNASTVFTLPQKAATYTVTFSGIGFSNATATVTAVGGTPTKLIAYGGAGQHDSTGSTIGVTPGTKPILAQVQDIYKNPVNGVTVYFTATKGGIPTQSSVVTATGATGLVGMASTNLQLPATPATVSVTACLSQPCVTGSVRIPFAEYAVAPVATALAISSGNNQSAAAGSQLTQPLSVLLTDQFGNPLAGKTVAFTDNSGGGTFSNGNSVVTGADGKATQCYTLPTNISTITINATVTGIAGSAAFSESGVAGPAANIAVSSGANQSAPAGTQLPQALVVVVTDQYGNPVSGVSVGFSDGGLGGILSNPNPAPTAANGTVSQLYTLPPSPGTALISATATGLDPAVFTESGQ